MVITSINAHIFNSNSKLFLLQYSVQGYADKSKDIIFVY